VRGLVWTIAGDLRRRGSKIDVTDPDSPSKTEQQLRDAGTYFDFTWTLVLNGLAGHSNAVRAYTGQLLPAVFPHSLSRRWGWLTRPTAPQVLRRSPERGDRLVDHQPRHHAGDVLAPVDGASDM